ncbi:integrator complex subunit 4 [Trichonephila inaurata madagascariensis]|uniref:Integrator complex subunit 4 n=1 Tax=Trichonephila inaurata madagascariensis TaxID=2747483 RepID=A0A8X6X4Z8_9ARAC|nr:integrator complex subunit 4 [Trichonephila inaurata madagascariensis]
MAAVLKKRALAEFNMVLQEKPKKPAKRLRIIKKAVTYTELDVDLLKSASSSETLQFLLQVEEAIKGEVDALPLYNTLIDHYQKEPEPIVRVKIISIFSQMVQGNLIEPYTLYEDLQPLLKNETSHKVTAMLLSTFHQIKRIEKDDKLHLQIFQLAKKYLNNRSYEVKCAALSVIGDFIALDDKSETFQNTLQLLAEYSHDHEPRVRTEALNALLNLHERGLKLDSTLYEEVCEALTDDYEGVRMAALRLIDVVSHLHSEKLVAVGSEEQIRLADDAFARICKMITDPSTNVRVLAASLLGEFKEVSLEFLNQTLDKKLISSLKKKRSGIDGQKDENSEWSTGKKMHFDAPKEEVEDDVNLISSGACGAFVHGFEDELQEVRTATLDSFCKLATLFPSFAAISLDFLVDMFNDETEEVCLKAIHCLQKISLHIMLREDQLKTILVVLEDFSMDLREALHAMLAMCRLTTKECLKFCIDSLLKNLMRYPQDKRSIWKCLQQLGARHPYLTLPLVPELLSIHPFIDMTEQNVEDPAYICNLILVFNAASNCPVMLSLFDEYTRKHYSYLKDTFPHLVPQLKLRNVTSIPAGIESSDEHSRKFLNQVLERVAAAEHRNPKARQNILETSIQDLKQLSAIEPKLSAAANCAALYIQCQLLLAKIISNKNWLNPSVLSPLQSSSLKSSLEQLLQLSFCLSHQFLGLSSEEIICLRQLRLRALSLQLMVLIRGSNTSALGPCEAFLEQVDSLQRFQEEQGLSSDSFTSALFRDLDSLEDPKPGTVARVLQPLLQSCPCPSLRLNVDCPEGLERVKQASAVIHEPAADSESVHKFTAGLVLGITMDAEIENVENVKNVKVKVKYPDQQVQLILPRLADFRQQGELQYRLYTSVLLSHSIWSEACHVEMSLVLDFSDTESSARNSQKNTGWLKAEDNTIELSKPVKVNISPKPAKKGI